jgi:putative ABC transport system substrate-binding protein
VYIGPTVQYDPQQLSPFREGLRQAGWVEGQNLSIEWHYSDGTEEWLRTPSAELRQWPPDVIFTDGAVIAAALKQTTSTVPIVVASGDLVGAGLVSNLAHPGGNITGMNTGVAGGGVRSKAIEILKEVIPALVHLGYLYSDPANPNLAPALAEVNDAASKLGVQIVSIQARRVEDFVPAFEALNRAQTDALLVLQDGVTINYQSEISALAAQHGLPTMCTRSDWVQHGCLMAYGSNRAVAYSRVATYVDRILRGARPGDLPVEQPTTFDLTVNVKTLQALGLTIPPAVLPLVTEWIQ